MKIDDITSTQDFGCSNAFINRNIAYILKVEYSTSNVVRIYLNFIIINLTNTSFTISIMTTYTAAVSCMFISVGNVYKVLSLMLFIYLFLL